MAEPVSRRIGGPDVDRNSVTRFAAAARVGLIPGVALLGTFAAPADAAPLRARVSLSAGIGPAAEAAVELERRGTLLILDGAFFDHSGIATLQVGWTPFHIADVRIGPSIGASSLTCGFGACQAKQLPPNAAGINVGPSWTF